MTAKEFWIYQDERYIEAQERLLDESNALFELLEALRWEPSTLEEHQSVAAQSAKHNAARVALRELREQILAARLTDTKKKTY